MKKLVSLVTVIFLLMFNTMPVFAASNTTNQDLSIEITSPTSIENKPVCEENIEITVTNVSDHELKDIACYLTILDKGRGQTYPVDEFGLEAYQTREIASIAPGESVQLTIPVKIIYVGDFKFNVCAIEYGNDTVYASNTLPVHITENSTMNNSLVTVVACIVPILTFIGVILFTKKKHRE